MSDIASLYSILEKIDYIETNIQHFSSTHDALMDTATARPAILMLLVGIAEQFNKMEQKQSTFLLQYFSPEERKGIRDIRNFIAHEYDGVDLPVIEWLIDYGLPKIKNQCTQAIADFSSNTIDTP